MGTLTLNDEMKTKFRKDFEEKFSVSHQTFNFNWDEKHQRYVPAVHNPFDFEKNLAKDLTNYLNIWLTACEYYELQASKS